MRHVSDAIHKCLILKNAQKYNAIFDEIKKRMDLYKQRTPVNLSANGFRCFIVI